MASIIMTGYRLKKQWKEKLSKLCFEIAWVVIFPVLLILWLFTGGGQIDRKDKEDKIDKND